MSLPGGASAQGTGQFLSQFEDRYPEQAFVKLGRTGWRAFRLGFGTYRCSLDDPAHAEALKTALAQGCNVLDTAANYMDGDAESLVGQVLTEQVVWEGLSREAIIVISKVGYLQGRALQRVRALATRGEGFPELIEIGPHHWHGIHPRLIEDQLTQSLARMHLDQLDVYLLHNPEYLLVHALSQHRDPEQAQRWFYDRLREAFVALEKLVAENLIQYYGLSSNNLVLPPDHPHLVRLSRVWRAYQDACLQLGRSPEQGHFAFLQFPYNLLEPGARIHPNNLWGGKTYSVLALARKLNLVVLTNRPFNAIQKQALVRLTEPPGPLTDARGLPLLDRWNRLLALLAQLHQHVLPLLPEEKQEDLKQIYQQLTALFEHLFGLATMQSPTRVVGQLQQALNGYLQLLARLADGQHHSFLVEQISQIQQIAEGLFQDPLRLIWLANEHQLAPVRETLALQSRSHRLQWSALQFVLHTPGVHVVLNGMRRPQYVVDSFQALQGMSFPPGG